jgi:hypothetical protein
MMNDLGDIEKRNKEYENLVKNSNIDTKHQTYLMEDMVIDAP